MFLNKEPITTATLDAEIDASRGAATVALTRRWVTGNAEYHLWGRAPRRTLDIRSGDYFDRYVESAE